MRHFKHLTMTAVLAMAGPLHAQTVFVSSNTDITSDPNAAPAIRFTANTTASATGTVTGNIEDAVYGGNFGLNGRSTVNGQIGTAAQRLNYLSIGTNYSNPARMAANDVYALNGAVYVGNFIVNNGLAGRAYSSTVILGGRLDASNSFTWNAPTSGQVSTLDLQGQVLSAPRATFSTSSGGTLRLLSTITADGGQATCTAGSNKSGCLVLGYNGGPMGGSSALPAALQLRMRVANGVTVTPGTRYTVVQVNNTGSGSARIATLSGGVGSLTNGFTFAQDTSDPYKLVVTVLSAPAPLPLFAANAGQVARSAAQVLDGLSGSATDAGMVGAITALQNMNASEQAQALRRLAPPSAGTVVQAANQSVGLVLNGVASRLEGLRSNGFQLSVLDRLKEGPIQLASSEQGGGLFDGGASLRHGAWVKALGQQASQAAQSEYAGYRSNTWGLVMGGDTLLAQDWVAGAALSYADTRVQLRDARLGDATAIQSYQLSAYASRQWRSGFLDGTLSWAHQDFSSARNTGLGGQAQARFGGQQWSGRLQGGMPLPVGGAGVLTPVVGLEWTRLAQNGYTETGAGALSLQVDARSSERWRSVVGAGLSTAWDVADQATLRPSVRLAWHHDLHNGGLDTTASFTGGGASFTTPGQTPPKDSWSVGVTLALQRGKAFTLAWQLDGERAPGYAGYAAQLVGRWLF